ncbi:hypothetical protein [Streptomyces sp. NPDC002566]|uniref:hypothetical protein n=1 Tax=Streptomyces sp. NPDC002566 TaxID=3364650 RepID=UPI00369A9D07
MEGSGNVWGAGWAPQGSSSHTLLSRWDGHAWTDEELPVDLTSTSAGSTVFDVEGVPGTRTVPAAGNAECESVTSVCGVLAVRGAD